MQRRLAGEEAHIQGVVWGLRPHLTLSGLVDTGPTQHAQLCHDGPQLIQNLCSYGLTLIAPSSPREEVDYRPTSPPRCDVDHGFAASIARM